MYDRVGLGYAGSAGSLLLVLLLLIHENIMWGRAYSSTPARVYFIASLALCGAGTLWLRYDRAWVRRQRVYYYCFVAFCTPKEYVHGRVGSTGVRQRLVSFIAYFVAWCARNDCVR